MKYNEGRNLQRNHVKSFILACNFVMCYAICVVRGYARDADCIPSYVIVTRNIS